MESPDEYKQLVKSFSDNGRKVTRQGNKFLVPHKFKPNGDVVREDNFDRATDISKLNQPDLAFLVLWKENKWNDEDILKKCNLPLDQAEKTLKRLAHFKTEDAKIKALASEATPERVLAKDMENIETGVLNDSQHKSLDRVAKIVGAFKSTTEVNIQQNFFQRPNVAPEQAEEIRKFFDTIATEGTPA